MDYKTRKIDDIIAYDLQWDFKVMEEMPTELHGDVKSKLRSGKKQFLFNLAGVKYMDSYGLGELVASFISISNQGGELRLINLLPRIKLMFEMTGLDKIFEIFDDEKTAVKSFH
jgi:anti-anti-sigma factor